MYSRSDDMEQATHNVRTAARQKWKEAEISAGGIGPGRGNDGIRRNSGTRDGTHQYLADRHRHIPPQQMGSLQVRRRDWYDQIHRIHESNQRQPVASVEKMPQRPRTTAVGGSTLTGSQAREQRQHKEMVSHGMSHTDEARRKKDTSGLQTFKGDSATAIQKRNADTMRSKVQSILQGHHLQWSKAAAPTLMPQSIVLLKELVNPRHANAMLDPVKPITELEKERGDLVVDFQGTVPTVEALSGFFMSEAVPAGKMLATRNGNDNVWRMYVTLALATGNIDTAFPVSKKMLAAFCAHLVAMGYSGDTVATYASAIASRQRSYHEAPILGYKEAGEWFKGIKKHISFRTQHKLPFRPMHLRLVAQVHDDTIRFAHDRFLLMLGLIGAMRPGELPKRDVCDWRLHMERDGKGRILGAELNVGSQKNHPEPTTKRFAYGAPPELCLLEAAQRWMIMAGLKVHPECRKWQNMETRGQPCDLCGRLFRKFCSDWPQIKGTHAMSEGAVATTLDRLMVAAGQDPNAYGPKSMRRGGLTSARAARIPEELRRRQSGHKSAANRIYEEASSDEDIETVELPPAVTKPQDGWETEHLYLFSRVFH